MTSRRTRSPEYTSFLPLFSFIAAAQASPGCRRSEGSFLMRDKEMKAREGQGFMSEPENLALSKRGVNTASKGEQENAEHE